MTSNAFETPQERQTREKSLVASMVKEEFSNTKEGPNLDDVGSAAAEKIYGGEASALPQERSLVKAMRPTPTGEYVLATGVVHRIHSDDNTLTVQFVPDQHRLRLPLHSVQPILDVQPEYQTVFLGPGETMPTRTQMLQREEADRAERMRLGLPDGSPLPSNEDGSSGNGHHGPSKVSAEHWGIPVSTLNALKNRSIPASQVESVYGRHYYTNLYSNEFYTKNRHQHVNIAEDFLQERDARESSGRTKVASHIYIPLEGPQLQMNFESGEWEPIH